MGRENLSGGGWVARRRFAGGLQDPDSKLVRFGARDHDRDLLLDGAAIGDRSGFDGIRAIRRATPRAKSTDSRVANSTPWRRFLGPRCRITSAL
jgi:hypothetical protein